MEGSFFSKRYTVALNSLSYFTAWRIETDGSTGYVYVNDFSASDPQGAITVELLAKPVSGGSATQYHFVNRRSSNTGSFNTGNVSWNVYWEGNSWKARITLWDSSTGSGWTYEAVSAASYSADDWYYVVVSWSSTSGKLRLYVNGNLESEVSTTYPQIYYDYDDVNATSVDNTLYIGAFDNTTAGGIKSIAFLLVGGYEITGSEVSSRNSAISSGVVSFDDSSYTLIFLPAYYDYVQSGYVDLSSLGNLLLESGTVYRRGTEHRIVFYQDNKYSDNLVHFYMPAQMAYLLSYAGDVKGGLLGDQPVDISDSRSGEYLVRLATDMFVADVGGWIGFVRSLVYDRTGMSGTDYVKFEIPNLPSLSIDVGQNVMVYVYDDAVHKYKLLFSGKVVDFRKAMDVYVIKAESWEIELKEVYVQPTKYYSKTVSQIVSDLLATEASNVAFGGVIGTIDLTVDEFLADGHLVDILRDLCKYEGADYRVDENGQLWIVSEPQDSGVTIYIYDSSGANKPNGVADLTKDMSNIWNVIYVEGDKKSYHNTETATGDGVTAQFQLSKNPLNLVVYVDGVKQEPDTDYTVDVERAIVTFITPPASGSSIQFEYDYEVPIRSVRSDATSIGLYGRRERKFEFSWVKDFNIASQVASGLLQLYSTPTWSGKVIVPLVFWYSNSFDVLDLVRIVDDRRGINDPFVVRRLTIRYPEGVVELDVGMYRPDVLIMMNELLGKVKDATKRFSVRSVLYRTFGFSENQTVSDAMTYTTGNSGQYAVGTAQVGYSDTG